MCTNLEKRYPYHLYIPAKITIPLFAFYVFSLSPFALSAHQFLYPNTNSHCFIQKKTWRERKVYFPYYTSKNNKLKPVNIKDRSFFTSLSYCRQWVKFVSWVCIINCSVLLNLWNKHVYWRDKTLWIKKKPGVCMCIQKPHSLLYEKRNTELMLVGKLRMRSKRKQK